jgi:hypothetical protein
VDKWLECSDHRCPLGSDREIAAAQIGREPEGMSEVASKCSYGAPLVLICSPVIVRYGEAAEPFPTMHWLTCPHLREKVGALEGGTGLEDIRRLINTDEVFKAKVFEASERYILARRNQYYGLPYSIRDRISPNATKNLLSSGPGGTKDPTRIKCLHIYLANSLAGFRDPIGEAAIEMIKKL